MATRPTTVPSDAILIYPGQTFGPGIGVQWATLLAISAQISKMNWQADDRYASAARDWAANASIYAGLGMPIPPPPAQPVHQMLNVAYADAAGNVIPAASGADGLHYAWVWESSVRS